MPPRHQGHLPTAAARANGLYDFSFGLYADAAGTQWVTSAAPVGDLPVVNGLFTALVDLTDAMYGDIHFYLNGEARYLRIGVRRAPAPAPTPSCRLSRP